MPFFVWLIELAPAYLECQYPGPKGEIFLMNWCVILKWVPWAFALVTGLLGNLAFQSSCYKPVTDVISGDITGHEFSASLCYSSAQEWFPSNMLIATCVMFGMSYAVRRFILRCP